ncbi:MAG: hypothetical protein AAFV71_01755 [Cyanobacteria bacterium J06633_8]
MSQTGGLRLAELVSLPDAQRQIVQLLSRSGELNLAAIASGTSQQEENTLFNLEELIEQGFVQKIETTNETLYRIRLAAKQGIKLNNIKQALAPGKPLAVILNPSHSVTAGEKFEVGVTVSNKGTQSALILISINKSSETLWQWCTSSPEQSVALESKSSCEVFFEFQVPPEALPGNYNYQIVVDAPQHYPEETPILNNQRLQVLPPIEEAVYTSDPTFSVEPVTSAKKPQLLQPGEPLELSVVVHNRSNRVDRFWLTCPDIEQNWYKVTYPEALETPGLVTTTDGLDLNPGESGEIVLLLNPPLDTVAGNYFPTINIRSANDADLVLLDVVYIKVLPVYLLNADMRTIVGTVTNTSGLYELILSNSGNTVREVSLQASSSDEEDLCTYTWETDKVRLFPWTSSSVKLKVTPNKWRRRPLFGTSLPINFEVGLEDTQQLPLTIDQFEGILLWQSRPWWLPVLLALLSVGSLGAIAFVIWWLVIKPLAPPKILKFNSDSPIYQQANDDFVRLNWQIRNPKRIHTVQITGTSAEGIAPVKTVEYNFSKGIPEELEDNCTIQKVITCKNVLTNASKPGDYNFEIKLFSQSDKKVPVESVKTNSIKIIPVKLPQINEFGSVQPVYENKPVRLNWKINNPDNLQELKLVVNRIQNGVVTQKLQRYNFKTKDDAETKIPKYLQGCVIDKELICTNILTQARQPGDYSFELTAIPQKGKPESPIYQKTETIKINPPKKPKIPLKIINFKINGKDAKPKYIFRINKYVPFQPLNISWKVVGDKKTKVKLTPAPGTVPLTGKVSYPISQQPQSETLTLTATSGDGEEISRSITIETFNPTLVEPTSDSPENSSSVNGSSSSSGNSSTNRTSPQNPNSLSPSELPPQFD